MRNLSDIQAKNKEMELYDPSNDSVPELGIRITLRPSSSSEVRAAQRANLDAQLNSRKQGIDAERLEQNNLNVLVACVESWNFYGDIAIDGEVPECTPEKVREIFTKHPWIRDQVKAEFDDAESFFG